ncbi:hypothetical protein AVEN_258197-1 [Araneus ventricosus]|uniref:Uncharacterized protein n=1 Tax=Araneus ventricosus TaxID=182803 RepID=A0A4Y2ULQ6_ARAVE|nr:hypothetical protein AVEN_258197-1 [Araneus ventricosus]
MVKLWSNLEFKKIPVYITVSRLVHKKNGPPLQRRVKEHTKHEDLGCVVQRWPGSALGPEGSDTNPNFTKDPSSMQGLVQPNLTPSDKRPPADVVRKFGEGVPAQVSSSLSNQDSKLRSPSQNNPRVASKQNVNITKLKIISTFYGKFSSQME